ncbi:MAG: Rieske 2Fe-2S domain-containing protein [Actinomycetota bacterium]|nr:Rieske 2Fe-2S domain-containing protein [Actinomycetota bacterium]
MDTSTVLLIAIPALVVLAAIVLFASARRRDTSRATGGLSRETLRRDRGADLGEDETSVQLRGKDYERSVALARAGSDIVPIDSAPPAVYVPPDPETVGVTRRQFLNRSIVGFFAFGLSGFGAAVVAFLWPSSSGGFGSAINVGVVTDVIDEVRANNGFLYVPEGRMWVTEYPADAVSAAENVYSPSELNGMQAGLIALWQTCPHLGCRVPECVTSQWFECPCHGSQYNQVGEKKGGPAPRGMDRFAMSVDGGGNFIVDTGTIIQGPPIGTNTTGQEAEGPNCIGAAEGGH